jgi:hypothetical protein
MAIDRLFAHSIGLFVIGTNQFYCPDKMTVRTNGCRLDTLPSTARRANRDRPKANVSNIAHLQNRRSTTSRLVFTLFPFNARWFFLPFL